MIAEKRKLAYLLSSKVSVPDLSLWRVVYCSAVAPLPEADCVYRERALAAASACSWHAASMHVSTCTFFVACVMVNLSLLRLSVCEV